MANVTRLDLLKRMFSDPKNYPYGFSRSGDFSINESKLLGQYGCLLAALVDGEFPPETGDDHQFLKAAYGEAEPSTPMEKAWVKYQNRINRPKMGNIYGNTHASSGNDVDEDDVIDDPEDNSIAMDDV